MSSLFIEEYSSILVFGIFGAVLSLVIFYLSYGLASTAPSTEKLSSYECGFDPYEDARHSFDIRFYLVAILFIIFDLEAVFFFPWSISLSHVTSWGYWTMIDFIIELGLGFLYAWKIGALEWE
jgi:NADH-quinone oxidoreductase subunit A